MIYLAAPLVMASPTRKDFVLLIRRLWPWLTKSGQDGIARSVLWMELHAFQPKP